MTTICSQCNKKVGLLYKVNSNGNIFCDDDCYEEFMDTYDDVPDDFNHPYIDDYDAVRFEYTEWLKWEEELINLPTHVNIQTKKEEMIESITSVIDEFYDYYRSEGDDGVFASEIYNYLLKLENLQKEIFSWQISD